MNKSDHTAEESNTEKKAAPHVRFSDLYFEELLTAVALTVVVASTSWGVMTRYVSHTPSLWTAEVASIAFAWAVFLGSAVGFRRSEHIMIDTFTNLLPARLQSGTKWMSYTIVLVVLVAMTIVSGQFTINAYAAPTPVLRISQSVVYSSSAVGFLLMTFRHLQWCLADIKASNQRRNSQGST